MARAGGVLSASHSWHQAVGNDLIDLTDSVPSHLRFAARILSSVEYELWQGLCPEKKRRYLEDQWALREAAYKYLKQQVPQLVFRPRQWTMCFQNSAWRVLDTLTRQPIIPFGLGLIRTKRFIHAWVMTPGVRLGVLQSASINTLSGLDWLNKRYWGKKLLTDREIEQSNSVISQALRIRAKAWVRGHLRIDPLLIEILRDSNKIPRLHVRGVSIPTIALSFTHDGQFGALAWNGIGLCKSNSKD